MSRQFLFPCTAVLALMLGGPAAAQNLPAVNQPNGQQQEGEEQDQQQADQDEGRSRDEIESGTVFEPARIGDQRPLAGQRRSQLEQAQSAVTPPPPNEFEQYVTRMIGRGIPRFGSDLLLPSARDFSRPADATVPPDYRLNIGDTIDISLTGSAEGSIQRTIDQRGKIFLPAVGEIQLAGVRQGDLKDVLMRAIGTQYRNFRVGVRTMELRGLRVFVTGYPRNPGAFAVSSLSTAFNAVLQAGGPAAGGSMRSARLVRDGAQFADIDLYEILINGDRSQDAVLENEDVIVIPPTLPQFAVIGSVQREAIFEMREGETLANALRFAGGANELADTTRLIVYSTGSNAVPGPRIVDAAQFATTRIQPGDIIQVLPQGNLVQPVAQQQVLVRIEGEVVTPGNYYVAPNTPLEQVVALAGGLTELAFPFGTEFRRQSIQVQQKRSFEEALDLFELSLATAPLIADSSQDIGRQVAQIEAARATLTELRQAEPDGRLVLDISPASPGLPGNLLLENGDRVIIPPRPTSVGVFGAVYRPASFQISDTMPRRVKDYVEMAGGPVRAADRGDIFVVRANGSVLTREEGAMNARALPGDVVFVPIRTNNRDILSRLAQISAVVFQFGLAAAAVAAIQ